jgi:hypothetical protein
MRGDCVVIKPERGHHRVAGTCLPTAKLAIVVRPTDLSPVESIDIEYRYKEMVQSLRVNTLRAGTFARGSLHHPSSRAAPSTLAGLYSHAMLARS